MPWLQATSENRYRTEISDFMKVYKTMIVLPDQRERKNNLPIYDVVQ